MSHSLLEEGHLQASADLQHDSLISLQLNVSRQSTLTIVLCIIPAITQTDQYDSLSSARKYTPALSLYQAARPRFPSPESNWRYQREYNIRCEMVTDHKSLNGILD